MSSMYTIEQCIEENIPLSAGHRDFQGYKGSYPDPKWPGGAKIAINVVLNYEEGGEYGVINGDTRSEANMHEVSGMASLPGGRSIPIESLYEYGTRAAVWRLAKMFKDKGIHITVYAVGQSILKSPEAAKRLADDGHEIASHGYRWIDHYTLPLAVEQKQIEKGIDAVTEIAGKPPVGWYLGRPSLSSKGLICLAHEKRGLELLWHSDGYADDMPYWQPHPLHKGQGILCIPHSFDMNDVKYTTSPGFANPKDWLETQKLAFDVLYEEGQAGSPKFMTLSLHSRLVGKPARFWALRELLTYIQGHEGVWFATREEIARHWIKTLPYDESKMNKLDHLRAL